LTLNGRSCIRLTMLYRSARPLVRIAFLSALIMFLEMLLVRWVGTEMRIFAYLQNGVLVAAILGLGLGCRNARRTVHLLPALLALTLVALVIRDPWGWSLGEGVTQGLVAFQDTVVWYGMTGTTWPAYVRSALIAFSLVFSLALLAAIAYTFRPLGQWLGAWMDAHPRPIPAYTANILGSLVGIAAFVGATVGHTRPFSWLLVAGVGLAFCAVWADDGRLARAGAVGLALALPLLAWSEPLPTLWSPYQKLTLFPLVQALGPGGQRVTCGEVINVNNVGYQTMLDLDPARMAAAPEAYPPHDVRTSHYIMPYELVGPREKVLVLGAGSGNDVAAALRAGARAVQAVEIDPAIVALGRSRHPNRPYASERVSVSVDDARAFFHKATGRYDLIWFGLLDSHTTPSAYANVRLDHFVYTRESFAEMKRLLEPSGVVVLLFQPETTWIAARLIRLVSETFGHPPLAFTLRSSTQCLGWGGLMLIGGAPDAVAPVRARAEADPELRRRLLDMGRFALNPPLTTDDWPYLYLSGPGLPRYHLLVGLACLGLGLLLRRSLFRPGEPVDGAMLLLGMGFMLLEVAGVSRSVLLFGTTWTVNAYVVGAIFGMTLLANLVASRWPVAVTGWPAAGLVASVLALAVVPTAGLAALPLPLRVALGGGFLVLPVFFSGLIFVTVWAATERKDLALGSNLLGSLLGGIASMLSMLIGFQALTLLTLGVYLGALLMLSRGRAKAPALL
jgi:SAM-dependent methyltransferase